MLKFYTPEQIRLMKGDEKLLLALKLREKISHLSVATVAEVTGLSEVVVKNFCDHKTTIPWPSTISAMLEVVAVAPEQKVVTTKVPAVSDARFGSTQLARVRARIRARTRKVIKPPKQVRRSVARNR